MAERIALKLHGQKQNDMNGENPQTTLDRENTIEVLSLTQTVKIAFDRATLQATGRRFYEPLEFTKPMDRSTPMLIQAVTTNEAVDGEFLWYRLNSNGQDEKFFSLKFTGGRIAESTLKLPDVLSAPSSGFPPVQVCTLVANHMEWTYIDAGISTSDDWVGAV